MNFMCLRLICSQVTYARHLWGISLEGLVCFLPFKESLSETCSSWPCTSGPRGCGFQPFYPPQSICVFSNKAKKLL